MVLANLTVYSSQKPNQENVGPLWPTFEYITAALNHYYNYTHLTASFPGQPGCPS